MLTVWQAALVFMAGGGAGFANSLAGSGTLITFPTLLALGVDPLTANVSNNVGLVPGAAGGAWGWRRELRGQASALLPLVLSSLVGGCLGALLLLTLPSAAFEVIVPVLVAGGLVLVAVQPLLKRIATTEALTGDEKFGARASERRWLRPAVGITGVYGGYFGAAQGIILMAVLGAGSSHSLHRNNAYKNVLAGVVNGVAAVIFIAVADLNWTMVGLIAVGSTLGALIGARVGTTLSPALLRVAIVGIGSVALVMFLRS